MNEGERQNDRRQDDGAFDPTLITVGESAQRGGYQATERMLAQVEDRPTAIFYFNDRMAMGGYDALRRRNLSIPNDIAIVGFDNQDLIAPHLYPTLTTMQLPHYAMGQWAMEHLLNLINGADGQPVQKTLDCPLVERQSA